MDALVQSQQISFNTLALRYQDDAYTLAYYLLGDDARAAGATQAAFDRIFRRGSVPQNRFRVEVLRGVLQSVRAGESARSSRPARHSRPAQLAQAAGDALSRLLLRLRSDDRSALVLVDVLGLGYREASQVLGCSERELARRLGRARFSLARAASAPAV